jgi:hypothetical protein
MTMYAALLSSLALLAQAAPAAGAATVTISCEIPSAALAAGGSKLRTRVFQIGPGSFRERSEVTREYGANLCLSVSCVKSPGRSEGTISSASVTYVVGVRNGGADAYWRATGATAVTPTHGVCRILSPAAAARP